MPVCSPDGKYIVFMSFRDGYHGAFRMNADGSEQISLTLKDPHDPPTGCCSRAPSWSTEGGVNPIRVLSSKYNSQNEIFDVDIDGTDVRQLADMGTCDSPRARVMSWNRLLISWSPLALTVYGEP